MNWDSKEEKMFKEKIIVLLLIFFFSFFSFMVRAEEVNKIIASVPKIISLDVKDMDITDILQSIALQTGYNIISSKSIKGRMTIHLKDVTLENALKLILEINGYVHLKETNIIRVMSETECIARYGKLPGEEMKRFKIRNVNVSDLSKVLNQLKPKRGRILIDEGTNSLIIIDTPESIKRIASLIKELDQKLVTEVFHLKYADPSQLPEKLKAELSARGKAQVDVRTGTVLIEDFPKNLEKISDLIKAIDEKTKTQVFSLKYADPIEIKKKITPMITKQGNIQIDLKTNKIIVTDVSKNVEAIAKIIEEFDKKPVAITKIFTLNYADAKEIRSKLTAEITKDLGNIKIDTRTNKIAITDTPARLEEIEKLINAWDERTKQVLIEAKIVQVDLTGTKKLGISWEYLDDVVAGFKEISKVNLEFSFPVLADTEPGGRIQIGTIPEDKFTSLMEALETQGKTTLLSNPRILAIDGQESKILVGKRVPYTTTKTTESGGVVHTYQEVIMVDVGVKLYVTPHIGEDNFITMKIHPEVSSVSEYRKDIPVVESRQADASAVIKSGETIVIGGLIKDEVIETISKVPLLGDIPILGYLFRKKEREKGKSELIIFLTPRIISGEESTKEVSPLGKGY